MPRDYKHSQATPPAEGNNNATINFLLGLAIGGLLTGLGFYHFRQDTVVPKEITAEDIVTLEAEEEKVNLSKLAEQQQLQEPTYEFYKILPGLKVDVTTWDETEAVAPSPVEEQQKPGVYVLQIGSFRKLTAADQVKAELALLGINADIQRVVINGQDVYHRVRIGPFNSAKQLQQTQSRLQANNIGFKLLKLTVEPQ